MTRSTLLSLVVCTTDSEHQLVSEGPGTNIVMKVKGWGQIVDNVHYSR